MLLLLTGCKESVDVEPTPVDPSLPHMVNTQLSLSFSGAKDMPTRMSSEMVQADRQFRGMQNVSLYPYKINSEGFNASEPVQLGTVLETGPKIQLPGNGDMPEKDNADNAISSAANISQFYNNIRIPEGTNAFVFYGEAAAPTDADPKEYGSIKPTGLVDEITDVSTVRFELNQIYETETSYTKAQDLVAFLTAVINTSEWVASSDVDLVALRDEMTKNIAGSSANVLALVQDLYTTLNNRKYQDGGDKEAVADKILLQIAAKTDANVGVLSFKDEDNDGEPDLDGYPSEKSLPDGAAYLKWNGSAFNAITEAEAISSNFDPDKVIYTVPLTSFAHPASLWYYANSPVAVTPNRNVSEIYEAATPGKWTSWLKFLQDYDAFGYKTNGEVTSAVSSVALVNEVAYGVARLDLTVQSAKIETDGSITPLTQLEDCVGNIITLTSDAFPVTGVLVGGQKPVDFRFYPTSGDLLTVYDTQIPDGMQLSKTQSEVNHTLLLQTAIQSDDQIAAGSDEAIRVAVEFQNNLVDFFGVDNQLIPKGCKFYMVGELKASNYTLNPGNSIKQVFTRDYTTVVNFKAKSLKGAYNVIPDLRLATLQLGLSVNLNWQKGIHEQQEIK